MLHTGLVSVTFRKLEPREIVARVLGAGLEGIEWGGDIHVPPGDMQRAAEVRVMTEDAGLRVAAYGSYYQVGCPPSAQEAPFEAVLDSAIQLRAPTIRVWAGDKGSSLAESAWWSVVIEDARRIASLASQAGVTVAFEYHEDTLTDTSASAVRLMREAQHTHLKCYWQPPLGLHQEERLQSLREISPWLSNVHMFHLIGEDRQSLAQGVPEWSQYLPILRDLPGDRFCMLEFVKDDDVRQFSADAKVLRKICQGE